STTSTASYTPTGKLAATTDANGNVTRYAYDLADRLSSVRDAMGRVTSYEYDALNRRTGVFNTAIQAGALLAQSYSANGHSPVSPTRTGTRRPTSTTDSID
ncbi:MAG: hypothetical protein IT529_20080, partial [Burkholderiales bacterium]|nr:hypothetical protein [Burkholderiales bacterium]